MKKKIETLLRDGNLIGNAEFITLNKAQQSAKKALERAKKEKMEAKHAYREALGNGEKDHDRLLELLTAFRQAQYMQRFHRAGHRLAKHRLHRWLETWLKTAEVPHEPKKAAATRSKTKKSETTVSAEKLTEKAAKKAR
ncbi:MAG: hypothetical protein OHK0019_37270 [Saprospiraceae bacterium]